MSERAGNQQIGKGMILAAMLLALGGLTWFFSGALERRDNPNRQLQTSLSNGQAVVELAQNRQGHYLAPGLINGEPVTFLLDTGATNISVPGELAERIGLQRGAPLPTLTAAGQVTTYATRLQSVRLGEIELHDVRASINPHMSGDGVLLGMSFLRALDFEQRDGRLIIRQRR